MTYWHEWIIYLETGGPSGRKGHRFGRQRVALEGTKDHSSIAMLSKCLVIPVLEAWPDFPWARGREQGQGYAAWRVPPAAEAWQEVVQTGLASGAIMF